MEVLFDAAWAGDADLVHDLIAAGVDVNAVNRRFCGLAPLHSAMYSGQQAIVRELLEADADVDNMDWNRKTPLHYAVLLGHADLVRLLLENEADVNQMDCEGSTVLHDACRRREVTIVTMLLSASANIHASDKNGASPLRIAQQHVLADNPEDLAPTSLSSLTFTSMNQIPTAPVSISALLLAHSAKVHAARLSRFKTLLLLCHWSVGVTNENDDNPRLGRSFLHHDLRPLVCGFIGTNWL